MSFTSHNVSAVPFPADTSYNALSGPSHLADILLASPSTHVAKVLETEDVVVVFPSTSADPASQSLHDIAHSNRPRVVLASEAPSDANAKSYRGSRTHFTMTERVSLLMGTVNKDVEIVGTQTHVDALRLHVYESVAGGGTAKILKLRQFGDGDGGGTKVEEYILGQTSWMMRKYVENATRDMHRSHMDKYKELVDDPGKNSGG